MVFFFGIQWDLVGFNCVFCMGFNGIFMVGSMVFEIFSPHKALISVVEILDSYRFHISVHCDFSYCSLWLFVRCFSNGDFIGSDHFMGIIAGELLFVPVFFGCHGDSKGTKNGSDSMDLLNNICCKSVRNTLNEKIYSNSFCGGWT